MVADSEGRLRQLVEEFERVCKRRKLKVNESKKKVMKWTRLVDGRRMNVARPEWRSAQGDRVF